MTINVSKLLVNVGASEAQLTSADVTHSASRVGMYASDGRS